MRDLTLRLDRAERCLRCTSDELPGTIGVGMWIEDQHDRENSGKATVLVDYVHEPGNSPGPRAISLTRDGLLPSQTAISIEEAVSGVVDKDAALGLWEIVAGSVPVAMNAYVWSFQWQWARCFLDLAEELAEPLNERVGREGWG